VVQGLVLGAPGGSGRGHTEQGFHKLAELNGPRQSCIRRGQYNYAHLLKPVVETCAGDT
jgi:hypothetical protein